MVSDAIALNDFAELTMLALSSEGLIDDALRRKAWPILLHVSPDSMQADSETLHTTRERKWGFFLFASSEEKNHYASTLHQIELDVNRSYSHLQESPVFDHKRKSLSELLSLFFSRNSDLYYFQGFHDVAALCQDVLLDSSLSLAVLEKLSRHYILRDAHRKDFTCTEATLHMIPELVSRTNKEIGVILSLASPFWAVSMIISLFSHDLPSHDAVARIFDVVIVSPPVFPIYLTAALVLTPKVSDALSRLENPDTADIHDLLRKAASTNFESYTNANALVALAKKLLVQVPPRELLDWSKVNCKLPRDSILLNNASTGNYNVAANHLRIRRLTLFASVLAIVFAWVFTFVLPSSLLNADRMW